MYYYYRSCITSQPVVSVLIMQTYSNWKVPNTSPSITFSASQSKVFYRNDSIKVIDKALSVFWIHNKTVKITVVFKLL